MISGVDPRDLFIEEARELLQELERSLIGLESDPTNADLVNTAFRALHTIKGSGTMFDLTELVAFAHHLESVFVLLRDGALAVTPSIIDLTLAAKDILAQLTDGCPDPDGSCRTEIDRIEAELDAIVGTEAGVASPSGSSRDGEPGGLAIVAASEATERLYRLNYRPSRTSMVHAVNHLALLKELADLGEMMVVGYTSELPPLAEMDPTSCYLSWEILLRTHVPAQHLDDVFMFRDEDTRLTVSEVERTEYRRLGDILIDRGMIDPDQLEDLVAKRPPLGEVLVREGMVEEEAVRSALGEQRLAGRRETVGPEIGGAASIKVRTDRLDRLVNLVGELVSLQAQVSLRAFQLGDRELESHSEQLERLVRESRELAMEMHMVPVETLFAPFRRLVRDLASDLHREVELDITGTETELDRNVVEALRDPLLHIVRNALDHGIESPAARREQGKSAVGHLRMSASYSGALVLITVEDDGAGIDHDAVYERAVERGIVAAGTQLSRDEVHRLIFEPGFSTAAAATAVSGRGVGMDVVKRNVERLNGAVSIRSRPGEGSRVELRIPLTLAIVEGLLAEIGNQYFLINLAYIRECLDGVGQRSRDRHGMIDFRGSVIPVIDLLEWFGYGQRQPEDPLVVVQVGDEVIALAVSRLHGNHQSVVKSLGRMLDGVAGVAGAVFLGDGTPALMLDVERLARIGVRAEQV